MIENLDKLNDQEISDKNSKINKRIAYIEKTNMYTSSLPQLRMMKASLVMEATSRIEKIKNDIVQQRAFPNESKIIGEDD